MALVVKMVDDTYTNWSVIWVYQILYNYINNKIYKEKKATKKLIQLQIIANLQHGRSNRRSVSGTYSWHK